MFPELHPLVLGAFHLGAWVTFSLVDGALFRAAVRAGSRELWVGRLLGATVGTVGPFMVAEQAGWGGETKAWSGDVLWHLGFWLAQLPTGTLLGFVVGGRLTTGLRSRRLRLLLLGWLLAALGGVAAVVMLGHAAQLLAVATGAMVVMAAVLRFTVEE